MKHWVLVLGLVVACGSKSSSQGTGPQPATPTSTPTVATTAPATFATVAELTKVVANHDGKPVEVTGQYLNARLQNVAGAVHYDVTIVDGKDSVATGVTCRTSTKVTVEPFASITVRGTLHGGAIDDCTITPR